MNAVRRRLFRMYVACGGDLADDDGVARFTRRVEASLVLLPPKLRHAIEIAWVEPEQTAYDRLVKYLAKHEGRRLTAIALRQRLSRGVRQLEHALLGRMPRPAGPPA